MRTYFGADLERYAEQIENAAYINMGGLFVGLFAGWRFSDYIRTVWPVNFLTTAAIGIPIFLLGHFLATKVRIKARMDLEAVLQKAANMEEK